MVMNARGILGTPGQPVVRRVVREHVLGQGDCAVRLMKLENFRSVLGTAI